MAPKPVEVTVKTLDAEYKIFIQPNTTGKQLFDQVVSLLRLREVWFFGLLYMDSKDFPTWLKFEKKILSQDIKKSSQSIVFKFRARFFPEEVSEELIQDITQRLFFLQVKESILFDDIYCPPETCVLLASYSVQAKFGDYDEEQHRTGVLLNERLLPKRVMEQFRLSAEEWEKRIVNWWKEHQGLSKEESMLEYLKIAQDLEMYGVNYFEIRNKKGTELYLGVDALGLNIYDKRDKLTPKIGFPWSEIRNISFNDKKFNIKPMDRKSPDFVFYAPRLRINRRILALCIGNHELYMRRRKPDSPEIQQIKVQAQQDKLTRTQERERIQAEVERRRFVEQDNESMKKRAEDLELKKPPRTFAESDEDEPLEEHNRLSQELDEKRRQIDDAQVRLQQERDETQREHERMMDRLDYEQKEKEKIVLQAQQHSNQTYEYETVDEYKDAVDDDDSDDDENRSTHTHDRAVELATNENASRHEENRTTATTKDQNMKRKLEDLKNDLDLIQDSEKLTENDRLHEENLVNGRNKYKTLKAIRQGNTKKRIDEFESM